MDERNTKHKHCLGRQRSPGTLWSPSTWEGSGLGVSLLLHSAQPHPHAQRSVNPPAPSRELPVGPYWTTVGPSALLGPYRFSDPPAQGFPARTLLLGWVCWEPPCLRSRWELRVGGTQRPVSLPVLLPHRTRWSLSRSVGGPVHCQLHDGRGLPGRKQVLQVRLWALLCPAGSAAPPGHEP